MFSSIPTIRSIWSKASFVFLIFIVLFAPPILPGINLILVVSLYALLRIIFKYRVQAKEIFVGSGLRRLMTWVVVYYLYYLLVVMLSVMLGTNVQETHYIRSVYSLVLLAPITFVSVLYILIRARELKYDTTNLMLAFVYAGLIQVGVAFLALLIPEFKVVLVDTMFQNTGDPLLGSPWLTGVRFFGFANSLLDLFGLGVGLLAVTALFLSVSRGYKFIIYFALFLVLAIMNARSGLVVAAIGFVFFLFYLFMTNRKITLSVVVGSLVMLTIAGVSFVAEYAPDTYAWVTQDVGSFIGEGSDGTSSTLFSEQFWRMPESPVSVLLGTGHSLYGAEGFKHSDVGYINDIWRTGAVGMLLLYIPFVFFILRSIKNSVDRRWKVLFAFFLVALLVFNIKASIWVYSPAMVIVLALVGYHTYLSRKGLLE